MSLQNSTGNVDAATVGELFPQKKVSQNGLAFSAFWICGQTTGAYEMLTDCMNK